MDIWQRVKDLEGKTLATLAQRKRFKIIHVNDENIIVLISSTNKQRKIKVSEIEPAYQFLVSNKQLTRGEIEAAYSKRNPVYVAAILNELPGVDSHQKPVITLIYSG